MDKIFLLHFRELRDRRAGRETVGIRGFRGARGRRGQWVSWEPRVLRGPRAYRGPRESGVRARVTQDLPDFRDPRVLQDRRGSLLRCHLDL